MYVSNMPSNCFKFQSPKKVRLKVQEGELKQPNMRTSGTWSGTKNNVFKP